MTFCKYLLHANVFFKLFAMQNRKQLGRCFYLQSFPCLAKRVLHAVTLRAAARKDLAKRFFHAVTLRAAARKHLACCRSVR